jgi:multisubunit Na+/H+ antiporter MnhB subunit
MKGMTTIVKTITRLVAGLILLYGIYILAHGHLTPGGGFPGGVVIAGSFILFLLAFGKDIGYRRLRKNAMAFFEPFGGFIFLVVALLGAVVGGLFFVNFISKGVPLRLFSAGIIPICNIAIALKVGSALFAIFVAFLILGREEE